MAPHARVLLRYAIMYLLASGLLSEQVATMFGANPELADAIAGALFFAIASLIEWFTAYARKRGWRT